MRYYIVDDDINIVKILTNIIEENDFGEVIGFSNDGDAAMKDILILNPDIVLVDLLMPKLDGNTLVKEVKSIKSKISFIMVSQVSDHGLVATAYKSGIEFFINKPINIIEVEKVINKVAERIKLENMLGNIRKIFKDVGTQEPKAMDNAKQIKYILSKLGMLGEKGTGDIIRVCEYLQETGKDYENCNINEICNYFPDSANTIKQRIRRSIKDGLTNLAHAGIEDYYSESFQNYSSTLFDFESVKAEMDFIRGKRKAGGKVNINKFFEGLLLLCDKSQDY